MRHGRVVVVTVTLALLWLFTLQVSGAPTPLSHLITPGSLTIGTTGDSPPIEMVDSAGNPTGFYPELVKAFAQNMGLKTKFIRLDWPGILPGLKAGKFDMAGGGVFRTPARLATSDFKMSDPFLAGGVVILVKKVSSITTWDGAKGRKLGGVKGEQELAAAQKYLGATDVAEFPGRPEGLLALTSGRIEAFALDSESAAYLLKTAPQASQLRIVSPPINVLGQGTAIRTEEPDLLKAFNEFVSASFSDGFLKKLSAKWFGTTDPVDLVKTLK